MKKLFLALALTVLTGLNLLNAAPWKASACECFVGGNKVCSGQCCEGDGTYCLCWDRLPCGSCDCEQ